MINIDGTNQKQLTNNDAADFNSIWKADDSGILFLSTRNGSSQLFCLPINGGEAKQITDFGLGISSAKLSLDGKSIIFQATVFPECNFKNIQHTRSRSSNTSKQRTSTWKL